MNKPDASAGFALPAVLVVIVLASSLAITCVTMVLAASRIAAGDGRSRQAYELAQAGFADACEQLRWGWPLGREGTGAVVTDDGDAWYETRATALPSSSDPRVRVLVTSVGHKGSSSTVLTTEVALEATGLPAGLTVAGDIEVCAPVSIEGSGVYASGDVSGRQLITFASVGSPTSAPPDWADGEQYPAAAVHASGEIFDDRGEEHDPRRQPATTTADTDRHTAFISQPPLRAPDELTLTSLAAHALPASSALRDGVVDIGRLPLQPPAEDATMPGGGLVIVVSASASDEGVRLVGSRPPPPVACPLTVVVIGDATAGVPGQDSPAAAWWGSLIVTGGLVVAYPLDLHGSLFARHLDVLAPLNLDLGQAWRLDPPPGYLRTSVIAREW